MLKLLTINNIAVIERAQIEFSAGFNVLTGETGAGKSILIDSINAVLGERTSRSIIRTGCARASVSALFEDVGVEITDMLRKLGYEPEEDGSVLLQRTFSADGKSICRLCGIPATAATMREVAGKLINIHGQHDSQSLLDSSTHIVYLDAVAENNDVKAEYSRVFRRAVDIKKELASLQQSESDKAQRLDYLNFVISELESAGIKPGEMEELKKKQLQLRNFEKLTKLLSACTALIEGGDDSEPGALTLTSMAADNIDEAAKYEPSLNGLAESLREASYGMEEVLLAVRNAYADLDFDAAGQQQTEERLDTLYRLTHKYSADESGLLELLERSRDEADAIETAEQRIETLSDELETVLEELQYRAGLLTQSRKRAAESFSRKISEELTFLNMPNAVFRVDITPCRYTSNGADGVEFLISANPGEEPRSLSKIASGGELSRIMLAIKSALSGRAGVGTIIYDEIDAGISGLAAEKVGIKLRQTSAASQVVCVTHLAQIASAAQTHLLIEKEVEGGRTFTSVKRLNFDGRVKEIARIMGGTSVSEAVLRSAEEMIKNHSDKSRQ